MSPNGLTASLSRTSEDSTTLSRGHSRRVSLHDSPANHQDEAQQAERSWLESENQRRSSEGYEAGSSTRTPDASAAVAEWQNPLRNISAMRHDAWAEHRRGNHNSAERKRRLTNSAHHSGRVRTVSGGFHSRNPSSPGSQPGGSSSTDLPQASRPGPVPPSSSMTDRTESAVRAPSPVRRHSSTMHRTMNTAREVIVPKWQPDSEVSVCPICSRQFTFWFRKHHCRKCGRVVCANCSPHRITIPRQFIVHPPESMERNSTATRSSPIVINLTAETGPSTRSEIDPLPSGPRQTSNPSLGGGEEVRLCNPCVPDPQPSPQSTMDLAEFLRQGRTRGEVGSMAPRPQAFGSSFMSSHRTARQDQHSPSDEARELRRQRGRGMIVSIARILVFQSNH